MMRSKTKDHNKEMDLKYEERLEKLN